MDNKQLIRSDNEQPEHLMSEITDTKSKQVIIQFKNKKFKQTHSFKVCIEKWFSLITLTLQSFGFQYYTYPGSKYNYKYLTLCKLVTHISTMT